MTEAHDYSDQQVRGLERYFPTVLSRSLIIAFFTLPFGSFWLVMENASQLMPNQSETVYSLVAAIVGLATGLFILIGIIVDLVCISHQAKHRRIKHFSLEHPGMTFASLLQNATSKHYLFVAAIFLFGVLIGKFL